MRLVSGMLLTMMAAAPAFGHVLTNGRVTLTIDDPASGFATTDGDRVDGAAWVDSTGVSTGNLVSNAVNGPFACNDPVEFFGQAGGYPDELAAPVVVRSGEVAVYHQLAGARASITSHGVGCNSTSAAPSATVYSLSTDPGQINSVKVVRTFYFDASTPVFASTGLRAYMPRVSFSVYPFVKVPKAAGGIAIFRTTKCGAGCGITDWNGRWLADNDTADYKGSGMMIIRSASSTNPAQVVVDEDDFSRSNVSSVVLLQPPGGWKAPLAEIEYLCFYDHTTWTPRNQVNGVLPQGCQVK